MALTYRSPLEENVAAYESNVQTLIASTSANYYRDAEAENFKFFNYYMNPIAKQKLITAGLYLSPFSAMPHSHPVCKTLENYFLYTVLAPLLDNRFYFVGIKEGKINLLKSRNTNLTMVNKINRYVTSADKVRYGNDFVSLPIYYSEGLTRHRSCLEGATLRDLVPRLMEGKAKHVFLHDELHYWTARDLITFLEKVKPEVMYATLVYPPEILAGARFSLHPWCYAFQVTNEDILFYPDGVRTEGYQQSIRCGYLLETKRVITNDAIYMVDLVQSKFAHHLVSITRGSALCPTVRSFGPFEATCSASLAPLQRWQSDCIPVSFEVVSRVYRYLRTLKKPDMQSAMAKLSQLLQEPKGLEIKFVEDFASLVIDTKQIRSVIKPELLKGFFGRWLGHLPKCFASEIGVVREVSLDEFVANMEPYTFHLKLVDVDWNYNRNWDLFSRAEGDYGVELPEFIDDKFIAGVNLLCAERIRRPYFGIKHGTYKFKLIEIPRAEITKYCIKICIEEFFTPTMEGKFFYTAQEHLSTKIRSSRNQILNLSALVAVIDDCQWFGDVYMRALSLYSRFREESWSNVGVLWFLSSCPQRVKFIDSVATGASMPNAFKTQYATVLNSVMGGVKLRHRRSPLVGLPLQRASLKGTEPSNNCDAQTDRGECAETKQPGGDEEECPIEITQEEPLCCHCGIELPVSSLLGAEYHSFKTVEQLKGRRGGWYSKTGVGYKYNGGQHVSQGWPKWLETWMQLNDIDASYYDCCLFQEYQEGSQIGFHSDDEAIFDSGSSIVTCNINGSAKFQIKCQQGSGSKNLEGPCKFVMPTGFQSTHKHAVSGCSNCRSSATFRRLAHKEPEAIPQQTEPSYEDIASADHDFGFEEGDCAKPSEEPIEQPGVVQRNVGCIRHGSLTEKWLYNLIDVPGDGDCFWYCMEKASGLSVRHLKKACSRIKLGCEQADSRLQEQLKHRVYAEEEAILAAASVMRAKIIVLMPSSNQKTEFVPNHDFSDVFLVELHNEHFQLIELKNTCVMKAIAKTLNRRDSEVLKVLDESGDFEEEGYLMRGVGVEVADLEHYFRLFGIMALVEYEGRAYEVNSEGSIAACYKLSDGHLEYVKKNSHVDNGLLRGEQKGLSVTDKSLVFMAQIGSEIPYKPLASRAKILADCFEAGSTGVLHSKLFNDCGNLFGKVDIEAEHEESVLGLFGTFGCGKSSAFKKFFQLNPGKSLFYVSPRKALADEFRNKVFKKDVGQLGKLRQRGWTITTFETFLKKIHQVKPGMAVVLDEIQLYPPGYLDLVMLLCPKGVHVIVGGDPCQSDYDNEMDRPWLGTMESDCDHLLKDADYRYNKLSRRFKNANYQGRLHCDFQAEVVGSQQPEEHLLYSGLGEMLHVPDEFLEAVLVSSFEEKKIVKAHFDIEDGKILTFGEATGLNFKCGTIIITNVSKMTSDKRWVTALSRFSNNVCFVNLVGIDWGNLAKIYAGRVLSDFLCAKSGVHKLTAILPGRPDYIEGFDSFVGKDEGLKEEKLQGDPWLKGMINLFQIEDVEEVEEQFEELQEEWFKTHLPREEMESVRARWVHKILCKEFREVRMGYNVSEQFTDEYPKDLGKHLTNQAERFEAIYPRHRANDTVTFLMAVKKRLRFSRPSKELAKLKEAMPYGNFMLKEFLSKVPLKRAHDPVKMAEAVREFEDKKTSKSAATIENHAGRSCRDWLIDIGLIFSKSQLCTKFDNRFRVAKAAQSIVCFQHEVLCRFAPYMRYIEKKLLEALPSNFYIHSGKGLEELNEWVKKGQFSGVCTESDYEAFDASQDQFMVAFEVAVMEYLGLPRDLIEDYKFIKTHLGSKLGNFAIMRFSGEASTFLFNTMANMLFTFLKYEIKGGEYICFAGDDMCASERLTLKSKHEKFLSKLKLKAKVFMVNKPTFCGWNLCPDGIYKKPQLVMERMCIAKERNNLAQCIDNYAIEVSFAYKLGERALNRMDEEEAAAFYNCVRIIIKNKHLLRSKIKELYEQNELA